MRYDDLIAQSTNDPEGFWLEAAKGIAWNQAPSKACDFSDAPVAKWFPDGVMNTCYNALDRHVEAGRGAEPALIYDSPVTDTKAIYSFATMRDEVAKIAGGLRDLGVEKGDRVLIYMPMVPQSVFAMLACARIGAVHSVVFGGFAAKEIAVRLDDTKAKVLLTATGGIEPGRTVPYIPLVEAALEAANHQPDAVVCLKRPEIEADVPSTFHDWAEFTDIKPADCLPLSSNDPLYILYTSGTTGAPKGIVRENGGHAVAMNWTMKHLYDVGPGQVFWAASDIGWVVGHSYIVYAPLLSGATTVLYEGKPVGTPDPGAFWRIIEEYGVRALFTAPTAMRAIKQQDSEGAFLKGKDISSLQYLYLAGERCDPPTAEWAQDLLGVPIIDNWWQTETAWAICSNFMGLEEPLPMKPGSPSKPSPGYDVVVLSDEGQPVPAGEIGNLAVKLPLPPSCFNTIWGAHDRWVKTYMTEFPGYYQSGDAGLIDSDGYVFVMSRTDDVMNVAGHRLSTGALEEVLASHHAVAECAVVGVSDDLKGQLPLGLLVLKAGVEEGDVLKECIALVREKIGPVAAFKLVTCVKRLPKTRSGKILRATIRKMADSEQVPVPPTIDDPAILDEIRAQLNTLGYAQ